MRILVETVTLGSLLPMVEIQKRAITGKPPVSGGRARVTLPQYSWENLVFMASQLTGLIENPPVDYFKEEIKTDVILGIEPRTIKLKMPVLFSAMSFGAVSEPVKVALARASSHLGTATNTGEGGMLSSERQASKILIAQYSTGRFGVDEDYLQRADAIEIKVGQGAKAGQGGLLPADKVTEEIARVRKVPKGEAIHSPPRHLDLDAPVKFKERIKELRRIIGDKPIIIKLAGNKIEQDLEIANFLEPDIIAIDGFGAGTGAAPEVMMDNFCIPTPVATYCARKYMQNNNMKQSLMVGGGINIGSDMAKAIALGANAVYVGFPALVAMGCVYCRKCSLGECERGIATQKPELIRNFSVEQGTNRLVNYVKACNEEMKMIAGAQGLKHTQRLSRENLRALTVELAIALELPFINGQEINAQGLQQFGVIPPLGTP